MSTRWRAASRRRNDEGSVLILVLVLMVIGSLIVLPLLDFATSVSRHNTVLSTKTKNQEAVKAGLRTALADPAGLYHHCGEVGNSLAGPQVAGINVTTRCEFIDYSLAEADEELHLGLAATRVGETIPAGLEAIVQKEADGDVVLDGSGNPVRYVFQPSTTDPSEWLNTTAAYAPRTTSESLHIWAPNLPVRSNNLRTSNGVPMPPEYPACTVYFPGTYRDPITLTGPVYFTSGIYYFTNTVTVTAGADVVVGSGTYEGCTTDQEAVFYSTATPSIHNISGLGGTFIFGRDNTRDTEGKLVITNATGVPKIRFNQRYVNDNDLPNLPSFGVSIMSVNGDYGSGPTGSGAYVLNELNVDGVNRVPASMIGIDSDPENPPVAAGSQGYQASGLTHEPRRPTAPRWTAPAAGSTPARTAPAPIALRTGTGSTDAAVRVQFLEPENFGGKPIDQYLVTASPGGRTCAPTTSPFECIVTGLNSCTSYTFSVTARNEIGTSDPSPASTAVVARTGSSACSSPNGAVAQSPLLGVPSRPNAPAAVRYSNNSVLVSWTEPNSNNSPITKYTVASNPAIDFGVQPCRTVTVTSCLIENLPTYDPDDPLDLLDLASDYVFTVTATNEMGDSLTSNPSLTSLLILPALGTPPTVPTPPTPAVVPPYEPPPIVDIDLSTTYDAVIDIPGYVSVPMGLFRLNNPHGLGAGNSKVSVTGGVLAAGFRVTDGRATTGALTVPIGLVNPVVQRTFKIVSETNGTSPKATSTAIVQINQNGAYAINSWSVQ